MVIDMLINAFLLLAMIALAALFCVAISKFADWLTDARVPLYEFTAKESLKRSQQKENLLKKGTLQRAYYEILSAEEVGETSAQFKVAKSLCGDTMETLAIDGYKVNYNFRSNTLDIDWSGK